MAEEVVVKEYLSDSMIDAGRRMLDLLDQAQLPFDGLLWFYFPEKNRWKLLVVSSLVRQHGPRIVYERIQNVLAQPGAPALELFDFTARDPNEPPASLLRKIIPTPPGYISEKRIKGRGIDGQYLDDAYIYRLK